MVAKTGTARPTRLRSTETFYKGVAQGLLRRLDDEWQIDPAAAIRAIPSYARECGWSPATWRLYRAALTWYLTEIGAMEAVEALQKTIYSAPLGQTVRGSKKNRSICVPPIFES